MSHAKYEDIPKEELQPMLDEIIGIALTRFRGFKHDSNGEPINEKVFYRVEKHVPSGRIVVMPIGKNIEKEFLNGLMNREMAKTGKLN